ncbi:type II toxin-antitoxin system PemK/MazF family toxin [Crocosphaera sp.]|uniref:type II toxin-antitoxin system PemK/MazF family toxin n=1 Tax=Crocosphaera sp. TaxID=2729996 RepID=UPI003F281F75|nr:type II toxin-antitoxin system PemK/MazF family toxin [Crocosphaera sp.]
MRKNKLTYRRGEIRWVRLDPTVGAEAKKTRACLIVQNDIMNQYGLIKIVILMWVKLGLWMVKEC